MLVTLLADQNTAGTIQANINQVNLVPDGANTAYILIVFTEKQNCNNIITALFSNVTTNCDLSQIDLKTVDLGSQDLSSGLVNFQKNGRYTADIYYQSSAVNLDPLLATLSYSTCLDVNAVDCSDSSFSCVDLINCSTITDIIASVDALTPKPVEVTGAQIFDTADGDNGVYYSTHAGDVNYTINTGFLTEGKSAMFVQKGTGKFTFVDGTGTIASFGNLVQSAGLEAHIALTKINGIISITGNLI